MSKLSYGFAYPKSTETDVLVHSLDDAFSKSDIVFVNGNVEAEFKCGTVLGKIKFDDPVIAVDAGNTGDGTIDGLTLGNAAKIGIYEILCTTGGASAVFSVRDPDGYLIAVDLANDTAFDNAQLSLTVATGATAWAKDDVVHINVAAPATEKFVVVDAAATNGSQIASAVLLQHLELSASEEVATRALMWTGQVRADALIFPDAFDQAAIDLAVSQLSSVGIDGV